MVKLKIGLYKHRETGQFDVMINKVDNTFKCYNGEFDLIKEFEHKEKTREDILREQIKKLKSKIEYDFKEYFNPVFTEGKTFDALSDVQINILRENLYNIMCKRRELLKVVEYEKSNLS